MGHSRSPLYYYYYYYNTTSFMLIGCSWRSKVFFVLFLEAAENLQREGILHDLSHRELSAGSWSEVSPSQNFLWAWGDQCVTRIFLNECYIICSALEKHDWRVSLVWCDSTSFDICINTWYTDPITVQAENSEGKEGAKQQKQVLQKWRRERERKEEEEEQNQTVYVWMHTERINQMDTGNWS